jgi:hypothetical protein
LTLKFWTVENAMRLFYTAVFTLLLASPAGTVPSTGDPNSEDTSKVQVFNEQNEKLGEASLVIMNDAGEPQGVVVKMKEIDASHIEVIVPVDRIRSATGNNKLVIAATREELEAMPRLQLEDRAPDPRADTDN